MACGDYATYTEFWVNGQFFDATYCPYGDQLGGLLFAMLFFGAIGLAIYQHTGSIAVPLVLMIVLASVVAVQLPPSALQVMLIALLLGLGVMGYLLVILLNRDR